MDDVSKDRKWLSLKEASKLLGIHPVTLRIWADAGKVASTRTPGGHRRFAEDDITACYHNTQERAEATDLDLKVQTALDRARWEVSRQGLKAEGWYDAFDQTALGREREWGQRLLSFVVQYATETDERQSAEILRQVRNIGGQMGQYSAGMGLSLTETVRAFLLFGESAVDAAVPALARPGRIEERDLQAHSRGWSLMREMLFSLLEAYQRSAAELG